MKEMNDDDPEIATVQTLKHLEKGLALLEETQKTFTDSISNNANVDTLYS